MAVALVTVKIRGLDTDQLFIYCKTTQADIKLFQYFYSRQHTPTMKLNSCH